MIFNIQKFCLHDGPGVRTTVFLKGCPLACLWCHNPESQHRGRDILYDPEKCMDCGRCVSACASGAVGKADGKIVFDRETCTGCGACEENCPKGACSLAGTEYTVPRLFGELKKELPFFEHSGGGVTFSGGEPLLHADFIYEAAKVCREHGISVAVDTSGYVLFDALKRVAEVTDLFLYDLKHMNPDLHRRYTGVDNALILQNLKNLQALGAAVNLRLPLIEGVNADDREIRTILAYIEGMSFTQINLLPYHDIGRGKYKKLGRIYHGASFCPPSETRLAEIRQAFEAKGYKVVIGG